MAMKTSAAKKSDRPNKRTTKPAPPSKVSQARSSKLTRASEPAADHMRVSPLDNPSLAARVEAQRDQLFKVISIVECCKFATATLLEVNDSEYMIPAFEAVCDLLDASAMELGRIVDECAGRGRPPGRGTE